MSDEIAVNDNLILIAGKSATGKSLSLMGLTNQKGVLYLNTESNKKLPFKADFIQKNVTDPYQIYEAFTWAEQQDNIHTIVIDSLTYMMDQFESIHVLTSTNTMKAWGDYAQFFKNLMNQYVAKSTKNVIFTAHTLDVINEAEMISETLVKVKGSLMNTGIESYFSTVVLCKKLGLKKLEPYGSDYLNITDEEAMLEFKYVYQTKLTKETVNERARSPLGMWSTPETFIDNNAAFVNERLHEYYN